MRFTSLSVFGSVGFGSEFTAGDGADGCLVCLFLACRCSSTSSCDTFLAQSFFCGFVTCSVGYLRLQSC